MPTSKEYRHRAEECLRLANETKESFARMGLLELAAEFRSKAQQLEFASAGLILGSAFALPLFIFVGERWIWPSFVKVGLTGHSPTFQN
jgi:hypothetical protein